jgi:hypothetical protein
MGMELEEVTASLFEVRAINHQGNKSINKCVSDQMGMEREELTASLFEVRAINHQGNKSIN